MAAGWATSRQMGSSPLPSTTTKFAGGGMELNLIQNCDLPPPSKLFHGSDHELVVSSMNRVLAMMGPQRRENAAGVSEEKLELLKAVRLSQTRAREAEKRSEGLGKEKECLSNALLGQSLELSAYRRWSRLLEAHVLKLEAELKDGGRRRTTTARSSCPECGDGGGGERMPTWMLAVAFCFGAGIVLGFTYWF